MHGLFIYLYNQTSVMPSLNQITTIIASHLDKEFDEPFKRNVLAPKVEYWHSTLIGRALEKLPQQRNLFKQKLWVPMTEAPTEDCIPTIVKNMLDKQYRSAVIPVPMRAGNLMFDYVGSINGKNPYKLAGAGTEDYLMANKYMQNVLLYDFVNGRIYSNRPTPMVLVESVFDSPIKVFEFNCATGTDCNYWDKEYPVTNDFAQMITQYILQVDYQRPQTPKMSETEVQNNKDQ